MLQAVPLKKKNKKYAPKKQAAEEAAEEAAQKAAAEETARKAAAAEEAAQKAAAEETARKAAATEEAAAGDEEAAAAEDAATPETAQGAAADVDLVKHWLHVNGMDNWSDQVLNVLEINQLTDLQEVLAADLTEIEMPRIKVPRSCSLARWLS